MTRTLNTFILGSVLSLLMVPASFGQQQQGQQGQQGQQDKQQGKQDQQQSGQGQSGQSQSGQSQAGQSQASQDQSDSDDDDSVSHESSSKKARPETNKPVKPGDADEPPPVSSDAAKASTNYNPFPAQQDIEVGTFYLHKGDVDAAIDRFLDAIQQRPNFAKPRLLLGQAYERKHDNENAVKYYKEYLKVLPGAPDAKQVQKKIETLSKKS
jgi:tetratricopeptide (TPR) repeat protein